MPVKILRENRSEYLHVDASTGKFRLPKDYAGQPILIELTENNWRYSGINNTSIVCDIEGQRLSPVQTENLEGRFESSDSLINVASNDYSDYVIIRKHSIKTDNEYAWEDITDLFIGHQKDLPKDLKEKYELAINATLARLKDATQNKLKDTLYFAKES